MSAAQFSVKDVRGIALAGRVYAHPDYHARQHHVRWDDCVYTLANCTNVSPDIRPKHAGTNSFVAFGYMSRSQIIRVDFQLDIAPDGLAILVVTAIPY